MKYGHSENTPLLLPEPAKRRNPKWWSGNAVSHYTKWKHESNPRLARPSGE
jgi:hypothetical protein